MRAVCVGGADHRRARGKSKSASAAAGALKARWALMRIGGVEVWQEGGQRDLKRMRVICVGGADPRAGAKSRKSASAAAEALKARQALSCSASVEVGEAESRSHRVSRPKDLRLDASLPSALGRAPGQFSFASKVSGFSTSGFSTEVVDHVYKSRDSLKVA